MAFLASRRSPGTSATLRSYAFCQDGGDFTRAGLGVHEEWEREERGLEKAVIQSEKLPISL